MTATSREPADCIGTSVGSDACKCFFFFFLSIVIALLSPQVIAQPSPTPVETEVVRVQPVIKKLSLSGTVTSPRVSQISTSVEGLVSKVYFDSGARVESGDMLVDLDDELEKAAFEQAKARAAQAAAELADAKRRLKIAKNLASRDYGPQNTVDAREAEVDIDQAAYESFKALEARAASVVERHHLKAPFSGVISKKMAEVGQWVEPGTAVFELVAMTELRIDAPVPQQYFARLRGGAEVSIRFDANPGEDIPATIDALIPVSDPDARTFTLRVLPKNKNLPITPGMSARVMVNLRTADRNVVVSRDALIRYPDGRTTVWVLEKDGNESRVKERRIKVGLSFDGVVQVLSGLNEGERVVVRGNEALREGQMVRLAS